MKISTEDKKQITQNVQRLEHAATVLKQEFVGIDDIIDQVVDLIRPYYIFPKTLKNPLVINLWGLTGMGKTSLVDRLVNLLGLNGKYVKFDMGEYSDNNNDYKLKMDLSDKIVTREKNDKSLVFVLDEFQAGRTITQKGEEVNRNGLRPIWDLMDTGKILLCDRSAKRSIMNYLFGYEKLLRQGLEVRNGYVYGQDRERLSRLIAHELYECDFDVRQGIEYRTNALGEREVYQNERWVNDTNIYVWPVEQVFESDPSAGIAVVPLAVIIDLVEANPEYFGLQYGDDFNSYAQKMVQATVKNLNIAQIIAWMDQNFFSNTDIMQEFDYSQSLVFCIGNLDEAYSMSASYDPDEDADIFYEHSLKITIPLIKEALAERFRVEQIGRLGNNHIIYPSLNKKSYEKIIQMHLDNRIAEYKELFDVEVTFDATINDILYKEGVFPSQGVRPVISTFKAIIDSYATRMFFDMITTAPKTIRAHWTFNRAECKHLIICFDKKNHEHSFVYPVKLQIDKLRESDMSEEQAFTGIHEAGHVVVSCVEAGIVPKEARSRTASLAEGFCLIEYPKIDTKDLMYKKICVFLAGLEAERMIFGDDFVSTGAIGDLKYATNLAVSIVKLYGMSDIPYQISSGADITNIYTDGQTQQAEDIAIEIIGNLQLKVQNILKEKEEFLLEVGRELSVKSRIDRDEIRAIAEKYCDNLKTRDDYYAFKSMIAERANKYVR